jgi:hypothetical protein
MRVYLRLSRFVALAAVGIVVLSAGIASAQDDARMKQLRLLCARLSGDLTDPGGMAAFRRCLTTRNPLNEIRRDSNIAAPADRPNAAPPEGFGRYSRYHVADNITGFAAGEANLLYVLDGAGRLWRGTIDGKDARLIDQKVGDFRFADGHLFIRGSDGVLWRLQGDGTERTRIDQGVVAFQPLNAGLIYVLGTDHTLWRETDDGGKGDVGKRAEVDHTVKDFQAIDASLVYVLGADGELWRETGSAQARALLASDIAGFQYSASGDTMYVLTTDAILWRRKSNGKPEQVDQSVAAFQAIDPATVFVLGRDGRLWRETSGRGGAVLVDRDLLVGVGKAAFRADDPRHVYILASDHKLWREALP